MAFVATCQVDADVQQMMMMMMIMKNSGNLAARLLVGDFGALWRWWRCRVAKKQRIAAALAVLDVSDHLPEFCSGLVWQL